jgi:hypothetical protein
MRKGLVVATHPCEMDCAIPAKHVMLVDGAVVRVCGEHHGPLLHDGAESLFIDPLWRSRGYRDYDRHQPWHTDPTGTTP